MQNEAIVQKYLSQYAESIARMDLSEQISTREPYDQALVIPVFNEAGDLSEIWNQAIQAQALASKVLIVLVFNIPDHASKQTIQTTHQSYEQAKTWGVLAAQSKHIDWVITDHYDLTLINYIHTPLPANQGVGLARKIGMDWVTRLYNQRIIRRPWVSCTDADVCLPTDYFQPKLLEQYPKSAPISALIHPFYHARPSAGGPHSSMVQITHDFYELYLRNYVTGLAYSGSPYAFHTIGSLIKININAYAKVRGFPKRSAGEDFYLLNKLAKVGTVLELNSEPVKILSRLSDRTPFGTGRAVSDLLSSYTGSIRLLEHLESMPYFFARPSFIKLKQLLNTVESFAQSTEILAQLDGLGFPRPLAQFIVPGLSHCDRQSSDPVTYANHFKHWFDAFRTLKWIRLSCHYYPKIDLNQAHKSILLQPEHPTKKLTEHARILHLLSKLRILKDSSASLAEPTH